MKEYFLRLSASPYFGITLCLVSYKIGQIAQSKLKLVIFNPLIVSVVICTLFLYFTGIPYSNFKIGANSIHVLLPLTTAILAVVMYNQLPLITKNVLPVLLGVTVGAFTSIFSVYFMCRAFGLTSELTISLLPKSITTAIALPITEQKGGFSSITVGAIMLTGLLGNVMAPFMAKIFRVNNSIAVGLGIGACSHALGTSRALQIGEIEGAFSSIAMCLAGLVSVFILLLF